MLRLSLIYNKLFVEFEKGVNHVKKILLCLIVLLFFVGCDNPNTSNVKLPESDIEQPSQPEPDKPSQPEPDPTPSPEPEPPQNPMFFDFIPVGYYEPVGLEGDFHFYFTQEGKRLMTWGGVFPPENDDDDFIIDLTLFDIVKQTDKELFFELRRTHNNKILILEYQFTKVNKESFYSFVNEYYEGEEEDEDPEEGYISKVDDFEPYYCIDCYMEGGGPFDDFKLQAKINMPLNDDTGTSCVLTATRDGVDYPINNFSVSEDGYIMSFDIPDSGNYIFTFTISKEGEEDIVLAIPKKLLPADGEE